MMSSTEAAIREEIAYYERKAQDVSRGSVRQDAELRECYLAFARRRQQLLAAVRDGRPEAWREYPT